MYSYVRILINGYVYKRSHLSFPYSINPETFTIFIPVTDTNDAMNNTRYTPITPDRVYLRYLPHEPTEADLWMGIAPNEWGNRPSSNDFIDLFAGLVRRLGHCQVKDVARLMDVDAVHLTVTVTTLSGVAPKEWIEYFTIRAACEMLEETDWESKDIARKLKFSAPAAFSRFFYRMKKMYPTQWRYKYGKR